MSTPHLQLQKPERPDWPEWIKTFILIGMGLYLAFLLLTGNLSNYINLRFAWLTWVGLGIFLSLGIWNLYRMISGNYRYIAHANAHLPLSWPAIFVVSLPLIFGTILPSQPLGADAISGGISIAPVGGISAEARYNVPPLERNVLDWLREFDRADTPAQLNGLPVDVIAFVYREDSMRDTQFMAARFTLSCCVADAFAIGMPVEYSDAASFADGMWVRVRGTLQAGDFQGDIVPIIIPETIEEVEEPDNPYLYS